MRGQEARLKLKFLSFGILILAAASPTWAWGPKAHRIVVDKAVDSLPSDVRSFYAMQRSYLIDHANDADKLALTNRAEAVRHFIYFDRYGKYPFPLLPHNYNLARQQYGAYKLNRNGILPWYIGEYHLRLTEAFRAKNWDQVRETSAWLAHYVADTTDPFRLTENYNGHLSGQNGVGDRIEATLFDRFASFLLLRPTPTEYLKDPTEEAFQIALENYVWADNYLLADRQAFERSGKYSEEYYDRLYNAIGAMVSHEISEAIGSVGSYWYTAWVNAGKPPLPGQ
jgi:hypothetical protein